MSTTGDRGAHWYLTTDLMLCYNYSSTPHNLLCVKCVAPKCVRDFDTAAPAQSSYHFCTESFNIGINVTPKGSFVDLHHDITRRGLSKTIGKCKKIWLLFPSTPENLELYIASAGFSNRLARIGSKLRGGIIVETDSAHELEFPAGTLHAVFTTIGGFLAGINYSTAECLPTMSRVLKAHLPIFHISPDHIFKNI
ncbi:uncharacterized protein LY89DRAFT_724483 [Mollisia scopiformis]|uniref:JmjC domain-containing protein n=1 Tax=Mollisia scopiformis TaxID=149040 RepID=A0A132BBY9_MOLSC|nr:uncharacterized protein LY89DRAFT_724483 [Mollisia scopiformis]KUJ09519.1 hypothetical protein LY89DRAFT_724483 [Mollisia scopiformis]